MIFAIACLAWIGVQLRPYAHADLKRGRVNACIKAMPSRAKTYRLWKAMYAKHNLVEGSLNRLKHFRAMANRFEKHAARYLPLVKLASARFWMRFMIR